MVDLRPYLASTLIRGAKDGYKDDAISVLALASKYIKDSSMPDALKEYLIEGFDALCDESKREHAFYLRKSGKGKRPDIRTRERNIEVALLVYHYMTHEGGVARGRPLSQDDAINEVATDAGVPLADTVIQGIEVAHGLSKSTIRDAFYEYIEAISENDDLSS